MAFLHSGCAARGDATEHDAAGGGTSGSDRACLPCEPIDDTTRLGVAKRRLKALVVREAKRTRIDTSAICGVAGDA